MFAFVVFGVNTVNAQCTPDPNFNQAGISPDSATNLPAAYVNVAYSTTMTAVVPSDTTVSGAPVTIEKICVMSLTSAPALTGLTWSTNTAESCFPGGEKNCMLIQASPVTADIGIHNLTILLQTNATIGGFIPMTQNDTVRYYRIVVSAGAGISVENGNKFFALQNTPNPFASTTDIHFNAPMSASYNFSVYNMLGEVVYTDMISAVYGANKYVFDGSKLDNGIYFYKLTNGNNTFTQRMIIQK